MAKESPTSSLEEIFGPPKHWVERLRGEALFRRDDPVHGIFLVVEGRLRLERALEDGSAVTLAVLRPGDGVAEAALGSDRYHCDAVAEVRSRIGVYPKRELLEAFQSGTLGWDKVAWHFAKQVRRLRALLEVRSIHRADDRVESYLDLLTMLGESWSGDRPKSAVAAELGLTPEALYRTLAKLEAEGRIVVSGRKVTRKT